MKKVIPAILTKDINDLKDKFTKLKGLVDWVQVDVMDNKFVPNISLEIGELIGVEHDFNLEAHLMIFKPEEIFGACQKAGVKRVIFHIEAVEDVEKVLDQIKKYDFEVGIALNPETEINEVLLYLDKVDLILFLSVHPGFQGQSFIPEVLGKIKELKKINSKIKIEIDGGVNLDNINQVAESGVDYIVVGSALLKGESIEENLKKLSN